MKNPFRKTTTADVAGACERAAERTSDPTEREQLKLGAELARKGLPPPHVKGSVLGKKHRG